MAQREYIIREETSGEEFGCDNSETVLAAAMRSGKRLILVGCRNGGCGMCKIRILQGEYSTGKMSRAQVSELEENEGYALACRTIPKSLLRIEVCRRLELPETLMIGK